MLLLTLVALQACSTIKLGYNSAPGLGYWWLDGYLDVNELQSVRLREDLDQLQQWHRNSELPQYADLLQRAQGLMAGTAVTPVQACAFVAEAQQQIDDMLARAEPAAVQLVLSMTPTQLEVLEAKYTKSNAEFRKQWLRPSADEMRKKRFEKALDRAESIYGRLDDSQRAMLRQQVDTSSFDPQFTNTERLRRQQDTVQTLSRVLGRNNTPEKTAQALRGLAERYRRSPVPQYLAYQQRQIDEGCQGFAAAHNAATPAQRDHAVKRLKAYERDLRDLAAQR